MASQWIQQIRPIKVLLFGVFLDHLGYYMVLPILPVMFKLETGLSPAEIGTILGTLAISFQMVVSWGDF